MGRGSIDTVINAIIILTAGVLILVYALAALLKAPLDPTVADALIYKNWFWWGLDMVADGNVLMYTSGVWYLLIPILTGRKLFGESVVKTVIMVDLLVSMGVWSHHLLGEQTQPLFMRILSGQLITWGEFFTMGLTRPGALSCSTMPWQSPLWPLWSTLSWMRCPLRKNTRASFDPPSRLVTCSP